MLFSCNCCSVSEPIPVRDGRYVVRGHVVEVKDGKQVPHTAVQPTQLAPQQQAGVETWGNEMPANYRHNGYTNSGFLYAMNDFSLNEGKLYSTQPANDPYGTSVVHGKHGEYGMGGRMGEITENGPVTNTLTMAEQEKLRAGAIAKSGPKLAFINDEFQKDPPEGALPCIMGRESPGGSVTSLDSLDELPAKGQELGTFSRAGIMAKGDRDVPKSAGKRRVTFSDSIEFDDGVTGQLVTEEKQSTKAYTMLFARNTNSYYNMPSASSVYASGQSGANQKGDKYSGLMSAAKTGTEQVNTSTGYSAAKTFGKEPSVATVVHCDQPKPKPVAIDNNRLTKPEKIQPSSKEENRRKEFTLRQDNLDKVTDELKVETNIVNDQELNDSLEVIRDSLDEKDNHGDSDSMKQRYNEEYKDSSALTWTVGSSELNDSLERYVQSTAESTAEELIDPVSTSDGHFGDRDRDLVCELQEESDQGSVSKTLGERGPVYTTSGYMNMTNPFAVTTAYKYYQPQDTSTAPAVDPSPHFYHHNANVHSSLQSPAQGKFHQNFPYPFYTSAGTKLMGMSPARQEQQEADSSSVPSLSHFAGTNYRPEGQEVVQLIEPPRTPVQEIVPSHSAVRTLKRDDTENGDPQEGGRLHVGAKNETNKTMTFRQKQSSSPSSTVSSTPSSGRSTRSLIPRPPAAKKTGRGRVHPGTFYRKQITARPRKAIHNHAATSNSGQSAKNKAGANGNGNNQTERVITRQSSASPPSGNSRNGRAPQKRASSGKSDGADHDGIIEGIKRNMEMMNMRARHTAAEEQHQRILNSLRLEFGDGKRDDLTQKASAVHEKSHREDDTVIENHATKQDAANRRIHHPRVGSAGSRAGWPPAGGIGRVEDGNEDGNQLVGSHGGRHPAGGNGKVGAVNEDGYQPAGSYLGRPPAGNSMRVNLANDDNYQPAGSRTDRPPAGEIGRVGAGGEDGYQPAGSHGGRPPAGNNLKSNLTNDENYQPAGSRARRPPPAGMTRPDPANDGSYQPAGFHGGRPAGNGTRMNLVNDDSYQLATSRGGRPPPGNSVRMDFINNDNYQEGFDGYPGIGRAADEVKVIVQKPPYAPGVNHQRLFEDRRHEYPTSTVGHPTSAATTRQEREAPLQARGVTLYERENSDVNRSISLDKTPTDDEINHLWAHVRSYLHGENTKSVGSDSCVNRVDVRRSRTRSSSMQQAFSQRNSSQQNVRASQLINGQHLLGVPPQVGGSTLGGLRRYGSHEVLRRDSSSDSLSLKRSPLLQHRASRNRRPPQKHARGQNGKPPLPRQHEYNPSPSQAGPSASVSTRGKKQFPSMIAFWLLLKTRTHFWWAVGTCYHKHKSLLNSHLRTTCSFNASDISSRSCHN